MHDASVVPAHLKQLVEDLRAHLCDGEFVARHRKSPHHFTRERLLPFALVMIFILRKTIKSLQRHLHELLSCLSSEPKEATAGAWSQARAKLRHTAFIELNQRCVLPAAYASERETKFWKGHRLLAIDGSVVRLPNSEEISQEFGSLQSANQIGDCAVRYSEARTVVIYDLLNGIACSALLGPYRQSESALALEQLEALQAGDVAVVDRGFVGYPFLARLRHQGVHFVARCSRRSFAAAQELFGCDAVGQERLVKVVALSSQRADLQRAGVALEMSVRFISLRLATGELEVLATSLMDAERYPAAALSEVYAQRWGGETYFFLLKSRLDLENFSGRTVEAVQQDFHSTVLLSNLERLLSEPAARRLEQRSKACEHPKKVNHAVAYHALKTHLWELLHSDLPADQLLCSVQRMFEASPVLARPKRKTPRIKVTLNRAYHFQRRVKKYVF